MKRLAMSLLLLSTACHAVEIELAPTSVAQAELSSDEVVRAKEVVAKVLSERGFRVHPHARRIEQLSREEWDAVVLATYNAPVEAAGQVGVSVSQEKTTGRLRVRIMDRDWPFSTDFTESLERALVDALTAAFPDRDIRVERDVPR